MLGLSVQLPQSTELLLKDRSSYADVKRGGKSSRLAMGTQEEVPDLTIRSCDLELGLLWASASLPGQQAGWVPISSRYFLAFTCDESVFPSITETRETTKFHSHPNHSMMVLRPGNG